MNILYLVRFKDEPIPIDSLTGNVCNEFNFVQCQYYFGQCQKRSYHYDKPMLEVPLKLAMPKRYFQNSLFISKLLKRHCQS